MSLKTKRHNYILYVCISTYFKKKTLISKFAHSVLHNRTFLMAGALKKGSHVAQTGLELAIQLKLILNPDHSVSSECLE